MVCSLSPYHLSCEYRENPMGSDTAHPRFSWWLDSSDRACTQSAYRIIVAANPVKLAADEGDLWDSGRVASSQSIQIPYAGTKLSSFQRCCWKVKIWDANGVASDWSAPAAFEMGILSSEDWRARWIGAPEASWHGITTTQYDPSPIFRRAFTVNGPIASARLYICGLGYHELRLNGQKIGDHLLDPAFTRYDRRVLYLTHDLTDRLTQGKNSLGVMLGNGWFNMHTLDNKRFFDAAWRALPRMIALLRIEYADGSVETVASDPSWKFHYGPIIFDSIRNGEVYDARREIPGWDAPDFDDAAWQCAAAVSAPEGRLTASIIPPIRLGETVSPVSVEEVSPGVHLFDMGRHFAGHVRLHVAAPASTEIKLVYTEHPDEDAPPVFDDGPAHVPNDEYVFSGEFQVDRYICRGENKEIWEPRFTYHGFRYVRVEGYPGTPALSALEGRFVHTDLESRGSFSCSNELFNSIQHITRVGYLSNWHGYPEDCPQREKCGWGGDAYMACEAGMYNFDVANAFTKWLDDYLDAQREDGAVPCIVPTAGWGYPLPDGFTFGPVNDAGICVIPWTLYRFYGDIEILRRCYPLMKNYVDYIATQADGRMIRVGLGDWLSPGRKEMQNIADRDFIATAWFYQCALYVANTAELLDNPTESAAYSALATEIREAIQTECYEPTTGLYATGSQAAQACALFHQLPDPADTNRVLAGLIKAVEDADYHLSTGFIGTRYLLGVLSDYGRADLAYRIVNQTTYPGWGYWVSQGATTLWERWNGTASRNHPSFGDVSAWFYRTLAGIQPHMDAPGFAQFTIAPQPVGDLDWVEAAYDTLHGPVQVRWERSDNAFHLNVSIPPNTTANVHIPCDDVSAIILDNQPISTSDDVHFTGSKNGAAIFSIGSGTYSFSSILP